MGEARCGHGMHIGAGEDREGAFIVQFYGFTQECFEPCPAPDLVAAPLSVPVNGEDQE